MRSERLAGRQKKVTHAAVFCRHLVFTVSCRLQHEDNVSDLARIVVASDVEEYSRTLVLELADKASNYIRTHGIVKRRHCRATRPPIEHASTLAMLVNWYRPSGDIASGFLSAELDFPAASCRLAGRTLLTIVSNTGGCCKQAASLLFRVSGQQSTSTTPTSRLAEPRRHCVIRSHFTTTATKNLRPQAPTS